MIYFVGTQITAEKYQFDKCQVLGVGCKMLGVRCMVFLLY